MTKKPNLIFGKSRSTTDPGELKEWLHNTQQEDKSSYTTQEQLDYINERLDLYDYIDNTFTQYFSDTPELDKEYNLLMTLRKYGASTDEKHDALQELGLLGALQYFDETTAKTNLAFEIMGVAHVTPENDKAIKVLIDLPIEKLQGIINTQQTYNASTNKRMHDPLEDEDLKNLISQSINRTKEQVEKYNKSIQTFSVSITDKAMAALGKKTFMYQSINPIALMVAMEVAIRHGATDMAGVKLEPTTQIVFGHDDFSRYQRLTNAITDLRVTPLEIAERMVLTADNGNEFGYLDLFAYKMSATINDATPPEKCKQILEDIKLHATIIGYTALGNMLKTIPAVEEVNELNELAAKIKGLLENGKSITKQEEAAKKIQNAVRKFQSEKGKEEAAKKIQNSFRKYKEKTAEEETDLKPLFSEEDKEEENQENTNLDEKSQADHNSEVKDEDKYEDDFEEEIMPKGGKEQPDKEKNNDNRLATIKEEEYLNDEEKPEEDYTDEQAYSETIEYSEESKQEDNPKVENEKINDNDFEKAIIEHLTQKNKSSNTTEAKGLAEAVKNLIYVAQDEQTTNDSALKGIQVNLNALINQAPDLINFRYKNNTIFMLAVNNNKNRMIEEILEYKDNYGNTALMLAAKDGEHKTVADLLENKADPNVKNKEGNTALMLASQYGKTNTAAELLDKNANPDLQNNEGNTALMLAVRDGRSEIVSNLLEKKAKHDSQNNKGNTALMLAVQKGQHQMVTLLALEKSDCTLTNNNGDTAIGLARKAKEALEKEMNTNTTTEEIKQKISQKLTKHDETIKILTTILKENPEEDKQKEPQNHRAVENLEGETNHINLSLESGALKKEEEHPKSQQGKQQTAKDQNNKTDKMNMEINTTSPPDTKDYSSTGNSTGPK